MSLLTVQLQYCLMETSVFLSCIFSLADSVDNLGRDSYHAQAAFDFTAAQAVDTRLQHNCTPGIRTLIKTKKGHNKYPRETDYT